MYFVAYCYGILLSRLKDWYFEASYEKETEELVDKMRGKAERLLTTYESYHDMPV